MDNVKPSTEGLKAYAQWKKENAAKKVDEAIKRLIKTKARINFNSVSTESGVSKAYLYNNQETRNRIVTLRKQQEGLHSPKQVKHEMSDASKDVLIAAIREKIKKLEKENTRLKQEAKTLRAKIYEKF